MTRHVERFKTGVDLLETRRRQIENFLLKHTTIQECVETAITENKLVGRKERMFALLCAGLYLVRGAREQALLSLRREENFSGFPVDPDDYKVVREKLGAGYWNDVYLAEPLKDALPRVVIKVEHPMTTRRQEDMDNELLQLREEYRFLKAEYTAAGLPDLIPDTQYLFATNPTTRTLAIAQIQVYAGDDPIDLMDEKNKEAVRTLLETDPMLKRDFEIFKTETLRLRKDGEGMQEPDVAGPANILIVKEGDRHVLRLVDPHRIHPSNQIAQRNQAIRLEYLRNLQ